MAKLIPKLISLRFVLDVVHPAPLGWDSQKKEASNSHGSFHAFSKFPYGLGLTEEEFGETPYSKTIEGLREGLTPSNPSDGVSTHLGEGIQSFGVPLNGDLYKHGDTREAIYAKNRALHLAIRHITTGMTVYFKAFITDMSDNYSLTWDNATTIGRNDPITSFQGIRRSVSVSWDIPSWDANEGAANLQKMTNLFKMLYPVYSESGNALSKMSPPMMGVKMGNLVSFPDKSLPASGGYLTGTIQGFDFSPDLEAGFWDPNDRE
jgi:hypothetical protein